MANTKSTQHEIDLTSELNLNRFKADIKPYNGFNERNSPYYGGCLSPLYIRTGTSENEEIYKGDDVYSIRENTLYKNGNNTGFTFDEHGFTRTTISPNKLGLTGDVEILDYYNEDAFVYRTGDGKLYVHFFSNTDSQLANSRYVESRIFHKDDVYAMSVLTTRAQTADELHTFYKRGSGNPINRTTHVQSFASGVDNVWGIMRTDGDAPSTYLGMGFIRNVLFFQCNTTYIRFDGVLYGVSPSNYGGGEFDLMADRKSATSSEAVGVYWALRTHYFYDASTHSMSEYLYGKPRYWDASGKTYRLPIPVIMFNNDGEPIAYVVMVSGDDTTHITVPTKIMKMTNLNFADSLPNYNISFPVITFTCENDSSYFGWLADEENGISPDLFPYVTQHNVFPFLSQAILTSTKCEVSYLASDLCLYTNGAREPFNYSLVDKYHRSNNKTSAVPSAFVSQLGPWRILGTNDGIATGISYVGQYTNQIGTLLTTMGYSVDDEHNIYLVGYDLVYYDIAFKNWVKLSVDSDIGNRMTLIGDYIIINTISYNNCFNTNTSMIKHWGSDWNNRLGTMTPSSTTTFLKYANPWDVGSSAHSTSTNLASAQNPNYQGNYPPSSTLGGSTVYWYDDSKLCAIGATTPSGLDLVEVYQNSSYVYSIQTSYTSSPIVKIVDSSLQGTYPNDIYNNIPLLATIKNSIFNNVFIVYGDTRYQMYFSQNEMRYQYKIGSVVEFDDMFVIQGQVYSIRNNILYSLIYDMENGVQSITPLTSIENLDFIGYTLYYAYFFSNATRTIYSFGPDNRLSVFAQADTITQITGSYFIPSTNSILIGTPNETYVLNENLGIYRLNEIEGVNNVISHKTYNTLISSSGNKYDLSYIEQSDDGWVKQNVILDTAFYGAGSNIVSVNDCWYVRVTDPYHGEGEIKMAVSTLTDIGRQTEERTFKIKANDWDELTDTFYIRFQPKLQRAVGVSLHIESPFKVAYIGVGATPETLQLNNRGSI